MIYLTNPNFADNIISAAKAEGRFEHTEIPVLNLVIECELRHLIEAAMKYMGRDRRDVIIASDVADAAREIGHIDLAPEINSFVNSASSCAVDREYKTEDLLEQGLQ